MESNVEIVHVFWDVERQCWEKPIEEIKKLGKIVKTRYYSMASRMTYWVEKV